MSVVLKEQLSQWLWRCAVTWRPSDTPVRSRRPRTCVRGQVGQKVYSEARSRWCVCGSSGDMNREDHYYPAQVFKDSCAYQRSQAEDYSHSPPPCLYMSRQVHSVYTPPTMGALEQTNLSDIVPSYSLPMREDPSAAQLHHPLGLQQQPVPPGAGYSDTGEQSRYTLPFPWMKTTKSHSHTWKGQWTGIFFL